MMKGKAVSSEAHGKGGIGAAAARAANEFSEVNGAPEGPGAHYLGMTGDGGMAGDTTVKGKNGQTFHFND